MNENIEFSDFEYASFWQRVAAFLVDLFVLFIFVGSIFIINLSYGNFFLTFLCIIIFVMYFTFFEGSTGGGTVGKRSLSLIVVDQESFKLLSYRQSFIRNILRVIDFSPYIFPLVSMITIISSKKNQRIGDIVAKSIVIKKKGGKD